MGDSGDLLLEKRRDGHRLLQAGGLLFLLGLVVGVGVPRFAAPRLALSTHLLGITQGTFLMVGGLLWPKPSLTRAASGIGRILGGSLRREGRFVAAAATLALASGLGEGAESEHAPFSILVTAASSTGLEMRCSRGCAWTTLSYPCSRNAPCWAKVDERGIEGRPTDGVQTVSLKRFRLLFTVGETGFSMMCRAGCGWTSLSYRCRTPGPCTAAVDAAGVRSPEPPAADRGKDGPE